MTTFIDPSLNYVGFQGDFTFDPSVVTFQGPQYTFGAGLTSNDWSVSSGILETGPGSIKTLRISAFSLDFTQLNGSGTLFTLRFLRVSSAPGATSPLVWQPEPYNFIFIDGDLNTHVPVQENGLITIRGPLNISGSIFYCSNPVTGPVPNVALTLTGSSGGSTLSDGSGNYSFAALASGGNCTVTPTKAALPPGSTGINTVDAIAVKQHFLSIGTPLSGCRLSAADVNGDSAVNTVDVVAIQRFFLGLSTGIANVGKYKFTPASRTYPGAVSNQTAQNYDALVFGDVASHFAERTDHPGAY